MKVLPLIISIVSLAETNDFCQKEIFFYGQQFERKPPEDHITNYDTGILYSIDLWKWTKNSTKSQGMSVFISFRIISSECDPLSMDHSLWSIVYTSDTTRYVYNVEQFKGPLEYAISLILQNNVYQFQLRDKRRNENPVLAFRNRLS